MTISLNATAQMIENEKIKLKATYYNNMAVALTATGILVPIFTVSGNDMQLIKHLGDQRDASQPVLPNTADKAYGAIFVVNIVLCFFLAVLLRRAANKTIEKLT